MQHHPLSSSMLSSAGYENGILEVEFKNGKRFRYSATQETFDGLINSSSPGTYYHQHIKGHLVDSNAAPPPIHNHTEDWDLW